MAITARRLITNALRSLGVLASGEDAEASQAVDALEAFQDMLDSWRLDSLLVYHVVRSLQPLTAGQGTYTLGMGGDWNIERPVKIEAAYFRHTVDGLELPMRLLTDQEYRGIALKHALSSWPHWLYADWAYPLRVVTVYPVPSVGNQVVLYVWHPLGPVASLDTELAFPPGYLPAFRWNLPVWLAPDYRIEPTATMQAMALSTKAALQTANYRDRLLGMDPALTPHGVGYNVLSDEVC